MRVVQHCFGQPGAGGPATALSRLQAASRSPYPEIWQREAAGGLSVELLRRFVRELRDLRPDLLHVRGLGNEGFHAALAARLARVPKVLVSVHGTQRDMIGNGGLRRRIVTSVLEPATLHLADAVVTVCEAAARRDFLASYRSKMLPAVPNGVALPAVSGALRARSRAQLGIAGDGLVGLCVSRITEQKGYGDLARSLRAYDEVRSATPWDVIVVGGGDEEGAIRREFADLVKTRVRFVGQQADVSPFYQAADLFLFPSWHENLSNALIEAMSFGLPAIATAVGGTPEVLGNGGGILIPPHDPDALLAAILDLHQAPNRRLGLGAEARKTIEHGYGLAAMEAAWRDRYARVLEG